MLSSITMALGRFKTIAFTLSTLVAVTSGCAGLPKHSVGFDRETVTEEILSTDAEIEAEDRQKPASSHPKIPLAINHDVQRWIDFFTGRGKDRFQRHLARGAAHKEMIQETFKKRGIPREIYYLGLIESGYVTHARSRQKAVGIWQFIPSTARQYGLKINRFVDERRDPVRSTDAAAAYLKSLHAGFNSWFLAMAAYNAGEGRIRGAIRKGNTHDFWEMVEKQVLPRETMDYIPKFLAAVIIARHPEKYGLEPVTATPRMQLAKVSVPPRVPLTELARFVSIEPKLLSSLNPHLLRGITPDIRSGYGVWLPSSKAAEAQRLQSRMARIALKSDSMKTTYRTVASSHQVRPGETLSTIATRYHMPVRQLKRLNQLSSSRIFAGQSLKVKTGI